MPLLFWTREDVTNTLGRIEFDAHPLEVETGITGLPNMLYSCEAPRADGNTWIFGWQLLNWSEKRNRALAIVRCATTDGRTFTDAETVLVRTNHDWQGFANLVRRPTDGALFFFTWSPGALHVFRSDDGKDWRQLTDKAYSDHDAMCVTWDAPRRQFLNFQTTLEPFAKRYPDNIGSFRRVLSFRRSTDGVKWESFSPPFLNGEKLWKPDADDPVDLEFYRVVAFPHQGRHVMLIVDYLPAPPEANSRRATTKHGPRYLSEWAVSPDGLNWQRPFRHRDVAEKIIWAPLQGPLVRGGVLRFYEREGKCASLPADRLFYATCRANGEFSTPLFKMPEGGLALNANARWRPGESPGQAYIMAELLDEQDNVIPGYERAHCLFENVDDHALPLRWGEKVGSNLA
ncbi:MAG: hypothetical protein AAB380_03450, partial [Verrucomicrobiota bacterium]